MCLDSTGKLHPLIFERQQWQHVQNHIHCLVHYSDNMESHPLLIKCAVKTYRKPNPLLFERNQWQNVEKHIHCLVKQQWKHMEIHLLPLKCDVRIHRKQHPLFFEREQWQLRKNHIHCLLNVPWQHKENRIHWFLREGSDRMWKTTSTA